MKIVIIILGLYMVMMGMLLYMNSSVLKHFMDFCLKEKVKLWCGIFTSLLGVLLIWASPGSNMPLFIQAIGWLTLLKGLHFLLAPKRWLDKIMTWWFKLPRWSLVIWGLVSIVLGVVLFMAGIGELIRKESDAIPRLILTVNGQTIGTIQGGAMINGVISDTLVTPWALSKRPSVSAAAGATVNIKLEPKVRLGYVEVNRYENLEEVFDKMNVVKERLRFGRVLVLPDEPGIHVYNASVKWPMGYRQYWFAIDVVKTY